MVILAELTLEQFTELAEDEGVINTEAIKKLWLSRPMKAVLNVEALHRTFQLNRSILNLYGVIDEE